MQICATIFFFMTKKCILNNIKKVICVIQLVIDSTCDMPLRYQEQYHIRVLPLQVTIDGKSFRDAVDIHIDALYAHMREGIVPKTAQVNLREMEELFTKIAQQGNDFIYLSFSSAMSGTYQSACLVLEEVLQQFPHCKAKVVDSCGGSVASGLIALQTARWIAQDCLYEDILSRMGKMIDRVEHLFTVSNLDWLVKGGRVQKQVGYVGDILHIKPILDVENKTMHVIKVVRGRKKVLQKLVQMAQERSHNFPHQLIGIAHADDQDTAHQLADMIKTCMPLAKTMICEIGCVLGVHLGIGGVGLFFFREPFEGYDLYDIT